MAHTYEIKTPRRSMYFNYCLRKPVPYFISNIWISDWLMNYESRDQQNQKMSCTMLSWHCLSMHDHFQRVFEGKLYKYLPVSSINLLY